MAEPSFPSEANFLVIKAPYAQYHTTEAAAIASARLLAECGIRAFVVRPLWDIRPSSTETPCGA